MFADRTALMIGEEAEPVEYGGLKFTAETAGSTLYLLRNGGPVVTLEYSVNGSPWRTFTTSMKASECTLVTLTNVGDFVYLRAGSGGNTTFAYGQEVLNHVFKMTGSIKASGNIQSILDAGMTKTDVGDYCFTAMFQGCESLTNVADLEFKAKTLAKCCYDAMFLSCTNLKYVPAALSASVLAEACYGGMFMKCTSLTTAPVLLPLPETSLAKDCYRDMFSDCSNLKISQDGGVGTMVFHVLRDSIAPGGSYAYNMFYNTGGEFTGKTPRLGVPYYCYS